MNAGRLPRGVVRVDRPVLGMSVQGGVKHAAVVAGSVFKKKKKKKVRALFGLNSNSCRRSDRDANTIVRRHSKRGYGGNGIGCRRSIENVQSVVRNRGAVVHSGSEKKKQGKKQDVGSVLWSPPVHLISTVRVRTCLVDASIKENGHAVLTVGFRVWTGRYW